MTRFWDGRTDGQTDGRTDGGSDCTPRPAFAFGDAGKKGMTLCQASNSLTSNLYKQINGSNFTYLEDQQT